MGFNFELSPGTHKRLAKLRNESVRLYQLPDRWLAQELLRLARSARKAHPQQLGYGQPNSYSTAFVWHLIPNLAARLGAKGLLQGENTHPDIVNTSGPFLRELASSYLQNHGLSLLQQERHRLSPTAIDIISRDPANGNPVAIALDRVAPPLANNKPTQDWLARYMQEISTIRTGHAVSQWAPDICCADNLHDSTATLLPEPDVDSEPGLR